MQGPVRPLHPSGVVGHARDRLRCGAEFLARGLGLRLQSARQLHRPAPLLKTGKVSAAPIVIMDEAKQMVLEGSERELVEACRRGDRDAFRALFEGYKNKVYSIALRFSGEPAAAMDIAQDTFLKLFSSIRDFRGDASFDTWIYRLVVNSCLDHKRRTRRLLPLAGEFVGRLRASGD